MLSLKNFKNKPVSFSCPDKSPIRRILLLEDEGVIFTETKALVEPPELTDIEDVSVFVACDT